MKSLYPAIEPYNTGYLKVSSIHEIYYEECGNPKGKPVLFLHGGPGGGIVADYRRFFDPNIYRIILFDQRGAGKSRPSAELKENTTWDLVNDIEKLRNHMSIEKWLVFGGSWGSSLALVYAEIHPESVKGLILRGIFLCREQEIQWFYQQGASRLFPDAWDKYLEVIPEDERQDLISAYYKRLTSSDSGTRLQAAKAWSVWEGSTSKLIPDEQMMDSYGQDKFALAFARIECHYFLNHIFLDEGQGILENTDKLKNIPCEIVHGRYDVVCPLENAWDLVKAYPEAKLHIMPQAGHSAFEPQIAEKLVEICDRFREL